MKTLSLALALTFAPVTALACGMEESYMPEKPGALYVFSLEEIEDGNFGTALTASRRIIDHPKATKAQKAKAWTVIAWLRMANGKKTQAREALASAKELDSEAIIAVLGKIKAAEKKVTEELRDEVSKVEIARAER